ncbi:type II CAAX prenyl endopeptidase Rce1 family protein [Patescibacteria group bacterium]
MLKWLFTEISWKRALVYTLLLPVVYIAWAVPMSWFLTLLGWGDQMERAFGFGTHGIDITSWWFWLIMLPFGVALLEEVLFRLPLSILGRLAQLVRWITTKIRARRGQPVPVVGSDAYWESRRRWAAPFVLPFALLLPPLFGAAHGLWVFVLVQGVAGLLFTLLYLKCGGGMGKIWKPLLMCTLAHLIIDALAFGWMIVVDGMTSI